jgi:hypothetical protein
MNVRSLKLAGAAASTLLLTVIPSQAFAQIDVLTARDPNNPSYSIVDFFGPITSTYTFNTSMILNSIDFVTMGSGANDGLLEYSISSVNAGSFQTVAFNNNNLAQVSDFRRRFTFANAVTLNANDVVRVRTTDTDFDPNIGSYTPLQLFGAIDSNVNVSVARNDVGGYANFSNSNLNVSPSNPGSNVAPEPGSIALLLTGAGALAGIALRRRRNAA